MGRKKKVIDVEEYKRDLRKGNVESSSTNYYVPNAILLEEWKVAKAQDAVTEDLALMFLRIASKFSNKFKYKYPQDKEDCIEFALLDCLKYWRSFNPEKSANPNPFAYFTELCKNGLAKGWNELGYVDCPIGMRMSISDNLYSI